MKRGRHVLLWVVVLATLGAVFAAYRNPHLMVTLANAVLACF